MSDRHVSTARVRRLAVAAEADPRSVRRVLRGETVRGMVHDRILRVLAAEGLTPAPSADPTTDGPAAA